MAETNTDLKINNNFLPKEKLVKLSIEKINNPDIQKWEKEFYNTVLEFLSSSSEIKVKTSGSTGSAQTISLKKQSMINSALRTEKYFNLNSESNVIHCLPSNHIAGKMMIVRAFVTGFNMIIREPSSNPFNKISNKIDFTAITPYQLYNSLISINSQNIQKVLIGGGPLNKKFETGLKNLRTEFYLSYGMTETYTHIAIRKLNGPQASSFFQTLDGISINTDNRNCILIKAPDLEEKEIFTNDIVEINKDKSFLLLGRYDNIINSGGLKFSPELIESKIGHLIYGKFIICGIPDKFLGEKLVLIIEKKSNKNIDIKLLNNDITKCLKKFEKPRAIFVFDEFPISDSGKISRKNIILKIKE